ncbi:MAG: 4-alpha-glucanotransferase [Candidatus Aureabacteria bacterium]|nr:4-alpha-glucanotransferase [Candidatus Auribacterota bacterium]
MNEQLNMNKRRSGVILHATSLPSRHGIGDLGPEAYRFADFLCRAKQSCWQFLPLNPTQEISGNSPYNSNSAFAGNTLLISPELLCEEGLLTEQELRAAPRFPEGRCDYRAVIPYKEGLLSRAYERAKSSRGIREKYEEFCAAQSSWLEDFALFVVLKGKNNRKAWNEWDSELRDRIPGALERMQKDHAEALEREKFLQYIFFTQWFSLKKYCSEKGILLIGDIPIYVNYDSPDVWAHSDIFMLDERMRPAFVAGVPPDYFSKTGQLWGNPLYRWDRLQETGFDWWIRRMAHTLNLFDVVRVDHFRGLVAYWEVPSTEKTAINGRWVEVPSVDFFSALTRRFPVFPIIAEDLGIITDDVRDVMERFGFPGMRIILFAFDDDNPHNPYLPDNYIQNCAAYTGTHDNNTVRGWIESEASHDKKRRLFRYLGRHVPPAHLHMELIRLIMMSVANTVVFPMQDILGLGEEARMNCPSIANGNWQWRLTPGQLATPLVDKFAEMTEVYGRA